MDKTQCFFGQENFEKNAQQFKSKSRNPDNRDCYIRSYPEGWIYQKPLDQKIDHTN